MVRMVGSLRMLAANAAGVGFLEIVIGVLVSLHLLHCLITGRSPMRGGTPVYRDEQPGMYWGNIVLEIVFIGVIFFGAWRDWHR
jgi:hypothetical protein